MFRENKRQHMVHSSPMAMDEVTVARTHLHVWSPLRLKDSHRCQTTRAHRHVWELVRGTVRVNGEELRSGDVHPSKYKSSTNMSLVSATRVSMARNRGILLERT